MPVAQAQTLETLRAAPMVGVDLNVDHLAAVLTDSSGNPRGAPTTIGLELELAGLPAQTRDGRLRAAISKLVVLAKAHGCRAAALVIAGRGLGQRARRREKCDSTSAEHGEE
jgi:hypothetical protein